MKFKINKIQANFIIVSSIILVLQILFFHILGLQKDITLVLILPIVLIIAIFMIENFIRKENTTVSASSIFLSTCIILFIQLGIGLCICLLNIQVSNANLEKDIKNVDNYSKIIKSMKSKKTKHFPVKIPQNALNGVFYGSRNSYFGGGILFLKFDTNSNYIVKELSKYKYLMQVNSIDDINKDVESYARNFIIEELNIGSSIDDYKFYIIGNNSNTKNCHDSCEYGIAVNEKTNTIVYYASNPD